jgi:hypothetical protein
MALFLATHFGAPVSTTHTIIGAIIGSGLQGRCCPLDRGKERRICLDRDAAGDGAVRLAFPRAWQLLF